MNALSKKMKILLLSSLLFNVLFLGFFLADIVKRTTYSSLWDSQGDYYAREQMSEFNRLHQNSYHQLREERRKAFEMLSSGNINEKEYEEQINKINELQGQIYKDYSLEMMNYRKHRPHGRGMHRGMRWP